MSKNSNNILNASQNLSGSTSNEAAAVHQTSAALDELTSMIAKNSENAERPKRRSNKTVESSDLGQRVMAQMNESLGETQPNHLAMA